MSFQHNFVTGDGLSADTYNALAAGVSPDLPKSYYTGDLDSAPLGLDVQVIYSTTTNGPVYPFYEGMLKTMPTAEGADPTSRIQILTDFRGIISTRHRYAAAAWTAWAVVYTRDFTNGDLGSSDYNDAPLGTATISGSAAHKPTGFVGGAVVETSIAAAFTFQKAYETDTGKFAWRIKYDTTWYPWHVISPDV